MSQNLIVLAFLEKNGSITLQQAEDLGISRLPAIVHRLRARGHDIELLSGWRERPSMYVYNVHQPPKKAKR